MKVPHLARWRRLDREGFELARIYQTAGGWRLEGWCRLVDDEERMCSLDYAITCDAGWRTRELRLSGRLGPDLCGLTLTADGEGTWTRDGRPCPEVDGCLDIDLEFSPATNLLPLRRLELAAGGPAVPVRAAWLRFPSLELEPLDQTYQRQSEHRVLYTSATGFSAELDVDAEGFVLRYPGFAVQ